MSEARPDAIDRLRVLFLTTDYPSSTQPVPGMFHRTQAEALVRLGAEVEVVAPLPRVPPGLAFLSEKWREYSALPVEYRLGPVQVRRPRYLHWPRRNSLGADADRAFARAAMACVTERPHIVHAHFAYPPGLAALRLRSRWRVPILLTLHGSDVNKFPFLNRTCRRRFAEAVNGADDVIAVSRALAETTQKLTGREPAVAPIGIPAKLYERLPTKNAAREILSLDPSARLVLYVGQIAREKGLIELVRALARLSMEGENIQAVFVGSGPLRHDLEPAPRSVFVGTEPNERIPLYMSAADLFVLPSYSEGMPTVLVEAGAAGLPVIATRVGGIPELLGDDRGLLIQPRSVVEIENAIRSALTDSTGALWRAERLRLYVKSRYDADENAKHLLETYRDLCGGKQRRVASE